MDNAQQAAIQEAIEHELQSLIRDDYIRNNPRCSGWKLTHSFGMAGDPYRPMIPSRLPSLPSASSVASVSSKASGSSRRTCRSASEASLRSSGSRSNDERKWVISRGAHRRRPVHDASNLSINVWMEL
eukprot:CAMPEP_0204388804 /NCGR_PEP_ID=MMETSP0469-20131031/59742_1 /ASSEMBLY_ACC=CAM_ASM_000384 /TAXON_ID=2969 /ORGANISM="Oxyrrhis marina" /LENGTH=127 /DNA_ID=CAMNT_0051382389 /DNA_START=15 /DNA_END=398 /DNA_ORIENTATION=+